MDTKESIIQNLKSTIDRYKSLYITFIEKTGLHNTSDDLRLLDISALKIKSQGFRDAAARSSSDISAESSQSTSQWHLKDPMCMVEIDKNLEDKLLAPLRTRVPVKKTVQLDTKEDSGDYIGCYTFEEKKVLYDYCLQHCTKIEVPPELSLDNSTQASTNSSQEGSLSHLEKLQLERDQKRRRHAYRNKVSTKNKSHIEITREMISNMMEVLGYQTQEKTSSICEASAGECSLSAHTKPDSSAPHRSDADRHRSRHEREQKSLSVDKEPYRRRSSTAKYSLKRRTSEERHSYSHSAHKSKKHKHRH